MLYFVTGVPGSGKTYYAVYQIWDIFINNKSTAYRYLYTNIASFKFGISPQFKPFNNKDFEENLKKLYNKYKEGVDEYELIEYSKSLGLYKLLLVLDEAHNFFDKEKPHLVFFLTYHRHFFCDLIFITQNLLLIHYKYRYLAEFFIKAKNKTISLNSRGFSYTKFLDDKLEEKLSSFTLLPRKEVFNLYHSGDVVRTKNYLYLYIFFVLIIFVFFIFGFFFLKNVFFTPEHKSIKKDNKLLTHKPILGSSLSLKRSTSYKYKFLVFGDYVFISKCNKYVLLGVVPYSKITYFKQYSIIYTNTNLSNLFCPKFNKRRLKDVKKTFPLSLSN